jgi:triosephosphate isomerase
MSKPILVANWKNYPDSLQKASLILNGLAKKASLYKKLATVIAPPVAYFESASKRVKSYASLGSQDIFFGIEGTYTGAITPDILKSFGVKHVIIGHSERRSLGETSPVVAAKLKTALRAGLVPIICIGEDTHDPDGAYFEFLREELKMSLEGVRRRDDAQKLIIAYEPVWAIGKKAKDAMQPEDLAQMVIFIKKVLTEIFGRESAEKIPVLYGGSVDPSNAQGLIGAGVKGFLVGRASLDPKSFAAIAEALLA